LVVRPVLRAGPRDADVHAAGSGRVVPALGAEVGAVVVATGGDRDARGSEVVAVLVDARRVVDDLARQGLERDEAGRERTPVGPPPPARADARVGVDGDGGGLVGDPGPVGTGQAGLRGAVAALGVGAGYAAQAPGHDHRR